MGSGDYRHHSAALRIHTSKVRDYLITLGTHNAMATNLTVKHVHRGQGRLLEVVVHRSRKAASGEQDAVKMSEVRIVAKPVVWPIRCIDGVTFLSTVYVWAQSNANA